MDLLQFVRGCTFDYFLFTPNAVSCRRDPDAVDLSTDFSDHVLIKRHIVSANMDTITRSEMGVVLADEGGMGFIDRSFRPAIFNLR